MKQKPDSVKTPAKSSPNASAKGQDKAPQQAMVSKGSAVIVAVLGMLGGLFIGWQGALMYMSQELAQSRESAMHQNAPPAGMPAGMPGGMPGAAPGAMPGGQGAELMAQAKSLEAKVAANPNDIQAVVSLANLYFDQGMHQKAIATYERALKMKNDMPDVWTDLGVMYRAEKRYQDALAAFSTAVTLDPKHEIARLNSGIVRLTDLNDTPGALQAWKDLLAINPEARTPDGKRLADVVKGLQTAPAK